MPSRRPAYRHQVGIPDELYEHFGPARIRDELWRLLLLEKPQGEGSLGVLLERMMKDGQLGATGWTADAVDDHMSMLDSLPPAPPPAPRNDEERLIVKLVEDAELGIKKGLLVNALCDTWGWDDSNDAKRSKAYAKAMHAADRGLIRLERGIFLPFHAPVAS